MNKLQRKLIKDCMKNLDLLNDWESNFIKSLDVRNDDYELSEAQNSKLNSISSNIVSRVGKVRR